MASQYKILSLLKRYYSLVICRRTLNYAMRRLEDDGCLRRIKRHHKGENGKMLFATSINILQAKGYRALAKIASFFKNIKWKRLSVDRSAKAQRQSNMQGSMSAGSYRRINKYKPPR